MNRPLSAETRSINGITVEPITPAERAQIDTNTNAIAVNAGNIATGASAIAVNAGNIATNTTNIASGAAAIAVNAGNIATNTTAISNKQDTITSSTDLVMDQLNVGSNPLQPGSSVITRMFVDTDYTNTSTLGNGFGNAIQFRFNRGAGGLAPSTQGKLSCYFKSGANSTAPYIGMKMEAIDDNTLRPLLDVYHQAPNDDGDSVLVVGDGGGSIQARTVGLTGDCRAERFLSNITGSSVGGYGFYRFEGNSGQINMNTTGGIDIPWTATYADTNTFTQPSSTQIQVSATGYYEVSFNVYLTSTVQRANPTIRIRVNGNDTGFLAWGYLRGQSNVNESHWCLSPVMLYLATNNTISVQGRFTSTGTAGAAYLYKNASSTNTAFPSLMIKRIA